MISKDSSKAKEILEQNELIAIPTETVYGLAGNAFSDEAIQKIYALKKRPHFNPLIVHIKSAEYLHEVALEIPEKAQKLANAFWPGPLTLVLKKQAKVPDRVTSGKDTVAVRMPDHPLTLSLLSSLDFPLVAPSANPFGSISPTCAAHVDEYFGASLKMVLDGGVCTRGIESTIIGFNGEEPVLYRHGSLPVEEIEAVVGPLRLHTKDDNSPSAPGMLSRHYAPKTPTYLTSNLKEMCASFEGKRVGVLVFKEKIQHPAIVHQEVLSDKGSYAEAASNLYSAMHTLDQHQLDVIIAEKLPNEGLGVTMNDRLLRATQQ